MSRAPNLITIGNEPYYTAISKSIEQFNTIYPDGSIWVYDWGFNNTQKVELKAKADTTIIDWESPIYKSKFIEGILVAADKKFQNVAHTNYFLEKILNYEFPFAQREKEYILRQKPYVFRDCLNRISAGPLIFLDGDAILNNRLPALERDNFDVGVTLRPHHEIEAARQRGDYHVLNSGVIMWNCTPDKGQLFVEAWIKRMQTCDIPLQEQSSLSKLVEEACPGIYEEFGNRCQMKIDGKNITVEIFDCREYNYNWVEEGWGPENRVLHFKSGRYENMKEYLSDI